MTNLDILSEWYRRVWIEGDLSAIDSFFAPSGGAEGIMADGQVSAEDFRAFLPLARLQQGTPRVPRHVACHANQTRSPALVAKLALTEVLLCPRHRICVHKHRPSPRLLRI